MAMTDIELAAAAAEVASSAMDGAESKAKGDPADEATICEKTGRALIERCNTIRNTEGALALSFAKANPESFGVHRAEERLKAATLKAQVETVEAAQRKVTR